MELEAAKLEVLAGRGILVLEMELEAVELEVLAGGGILVLQIKLDAAELEVLAGGRILVLVIKLEVLPGGGARGAARHRSWRCCPAAELEVLVGGRARCADRRREDLLEARWEQRPGDRGGSRPGAVDRILPIWGISCNVLNCIVP